MKPTLVILAAGMGSRYGGLKQLERVGPGGETIMDYSIFDALRAGFGRVVFVIRPDMEAVFREQIGARYEDRLPVAYAFQRLDALPAGLVPPPGRTKPWGTAHAVLAAEPEVHEPFGVINADDFYGAGAFEVLAGALRTPDEGDVPTHVLVAYILRDTLSDAGHVNRGVCRSTPDGWLEKITEMIKIRPHGDDAVYYDADGTEHIVPGDSLVSMNTFGFRLVFFEQLRARFARFIAQHADSPAAEFHLPVGIQELIDAGQARMRVLPTRDKWCGVTYPEDKPRVVRMIRELVAAGRYPERLWT